MGRITDIIEILEKGKKYPIGTVRNGYKKVSEGKWVHVGEGKTKKKDQQAIREQRVEWMEKNIDKIVSQLTNPQNIGHYSPGTKIFTTYLNLKDVPGNWKEGTDTEIGVIVSEDTEGKYGVSKLSPSSRQSFSSEARKAETDLVRVLKRHEDKVKKIVDKGIKKYEGKVS
jgi:hypothetical protein